MLTPTTRKRQHMNNDMLMEQLSIIRAEAERLIQQAGLRPIAAHPLLEAVSTLETTVTAAQAKDVALHAALEQAEDTSAQFQQVLRNDPTGICVLHGREFIYTFTNPIYEQFVGRTDMVGKTVRALFPEVAEQGIFELLDQIYTTGVPRSILERLIRLDRRGTGELEDVYFDLTYVPLRDADGTVTGIVNYVVDVSDRRNLEQERTRVLQLTQAALDAAEAERQRLLSILHAVPAAISTHVGPEHIYTFTNTVYDQIIRRDVLGKSVRQAFPEVDGQGFYELFDQVYTTGVPFVGLEMPVTLDHVDGTTDHIFVNLSYIPMRDAERTITGIFEHTLDVTELVVARQKAEAAVAFRDQFLGIAAHELKTPLTALLGYSQVLERRLARSGSTDERTHRGLGQIAAQAQRLNTLIDALLDIARINEGRLSLTCHPFDLSALVQRVVATIGETVEQHTLRVAGVDQPVIIDGDALRFEQVLVNLLTNAIKYSPGGGTITIQLTHDATQASIAVADQGVGIPADAMPHLFERFYRVGSAATTHMIGMGIGLFVVHEIVTLHGGTITVASTEAVGSTFTVSLPQTPGGAGWTS